ncbi:MAG: DmsC/YnfH family molybdoenzyme membrane anchor subunit [Candidatus Caldarchaeum sp.]
MASYPLEKQRVWEWLALGNFLVGGAGGGLYAVAFLTGLTDLPLTLASAGLIAAGLAFVGLEAGNPTKAFHVFRNFRHSWMSREAVFATGFVLFSVLDVLRPSVLFKTLAWFCSAAYVVSQGFMLAAAKKIPSWNTPATPPLFVVLSLSAGLGIAAVLNKIQNPTAPILLGLSTIVLGASYATWPGATKYFKQSLKAEGNLVYLLFSMAAAAVAVASSPTSMLLAGAMLLLSSSLFKYVVIIRMSYKLPVLPPLEP